jgi:cytochrome P450
MATPSLSVADSQDIATPRGASGLLDLLLQNQCLLSLSARVGSSLASIWGRPFKIGPFVIAARHADVSEVLARDLDFLIAPINAARIEAVNGPFVLGMDRGYTLAVERNALYSALRQVDKSKIRDEVVRAAAEVITRAGSGPLDVIGDYARPIAARTAKALFGISGSGERLFMDVARAIFAHTFLNVTGDHAIEARALKAAALMHAWFETEIARRRASGEFGHDMMGALMRERLLDDNGVRRTLGGMLVGSIDTTASAVAKIVKTLGSDRDLRARITRDAGDTTRLGGWCAEALRRWPHNPAMLRSAAADTRLGATAVKAGATVVAWTQAAMLDASAFPEPALLTPERPRAAYFHFGGALHHCGGRSINEFQIPLLVGALLARGIERVGSIQWAGQFPDHLEVRFTEQRS